MITAKVDTSQPDFFVRNRVRVVASYNDPYTIFARTADGNDYQYIVNGSDLPEGVTPYVLDARTDVARAVYLALKAHFEPEAPVLVASDRAYADAREDIGRLSALVEKLVDVTAREPVVLLGTPVSPKPLS